jgi:AcrR family transcriptional regulator
MSPRTTEQFEAIRQERSAEILEAALYVFAEQGFHSSSVAAIAKRAGISKGLLYNYFESKEEVLKRLMNDLVDFAMRELEIEDLQEMTDERFEQIIAKSIDIPLQEPQRWKLFMSLSMQQDVTEMLIEEVLGRFAPYMQSLSAYFSSKGYDDPMAMMRIFSALLDGVQMHCLVDPEHFPAEKAKEFLIDQFVRK